MLIKAPEAAKMLDIRFARLYELTRQRIVPAARKSSKSLTSRRVQNTGFETLGKNNLQPLRFNSNVDSREESQTIGAMLRKVQTASLS